MWHVFKYSYIKAYVLSLNKIFLEMLQETEYTCHLQGGVLSG